MKALLATLLALGAVAALSTAAELPSGAAATYTQIAAQASPGDRAWALAEGRKLVGETGAAREAAALTVARARRAGQAPAPGDVEALALMVLMESLRLTEEELKVIGARVNAQKAAARQLAAALARLRADLAGQAGQPDSAACRRPRCGTSLSALAEIAPALGAAGVRSDFGGRPVATVGDLRAVEQDVRKRIDEAGSAQQMALVALQRAMSRRTEHLSPIGNLAKKVSDASAGGATRTLK